MIHIPDPCNEDFSKMTPTERGAFCQKCSIDTFDFRNMSTDQINHILLKNKGEHVCGQISTAQLNALNAGYQDWKNQSKKTFQSKFVLALVVVFGLTLFACQEEEKQIIEEVNQIELTEQAAKLPYVNQELNDRSFDLIDYVIAPLEEIEIVPIECDIDYNEISEKDTITDELRPDYIQKGFIAGGISYKDPSYIEYIENTVTADTSDSILAEPILSEGNHFEAKAFPNPTQSLSNIALDVTTEGKFDIILYNLNGQMISNIHSGNLFEGRHQFEIDLSDFDSGLFMVNIISKEQKEVLKIQKIK